MKKTSNKLTWKELSYFLLGIALGLLFTAVSLQVAIKELGYENQGSYNGGLIKIRANRIHDLATYEHVAYHEYAHHIWEKYLSHKDRKVWSEIVKECGYNSDYALTYRTTKAKNSEEFAEDYSYYIQGWPLCEEKKEFIKQWVGNNTFTVPNYRLAKS